MNSAKTKEEIKRKRIYDMMILPEKEKRRAKRKTGEVDISQAGTNVRKCKNSIVSSKTQR